MDTQDALELVNTRQDDLVQALIGYAHAKYDLESEKANLTVSGVEGKNKEQRDAKLREQLTTLFHAEHLANVAVIQAKGSFANANRQFEMSMLERNKSPKELF